MGLINTEDLLKHLKGFQLNHPTQRHYIVFALGKLRKDEQLTKIESQALYDFIDYYLEQ